MVRVEGLNRQAVKPTPRGFCSTHGFPLQLCRSRSACYSSPGRRCRSQRPGLCRFILHPRRIVRPSLAFFAWLRESDGVVGDLVCRRASQSISFAWSMALVLVVLRNDDAAWVGVWK